ncbi:hypothetical protein C0992_011356 [Termitomyces sp. T32_za158]|nr:hypothetical protein C0992_011356 [Termitomyces sp. T32_za158]
MDIDVCEPPHSPAAAVRHPSSNRGTKRLCPPTLIPPLTFYDRHLAENHRLKKVEPFPQLLACIHQAEARIRGSCRHADATLSRSEVRLGKPHDAYAAAMAYQATEAQHAMRLASSLLLRSKSPAWFVSISWEQLNRSQWSIIERNTAFIEDFGLRMKDLMELENRMLDKMDEESRAILHGMKHRLPALAFWEIFCMSSETEAVLKGLHVLSSDHLDHYKCRTKGCISAPTVPPFHLDATTTAWEFPISSMSSAVVPKIKPCDNVKSDLFASNGTFKRLPELRSQQHLRQSMSDLDQRLPPALNIVTSPSLTLNSWPNIIIPRRAAVKSMGSAFLLRAWARAVEHDTTFIIFRCGDNFERIAFRHRASQTLYISDLINLSSYPSYRHLQTGLYLSIVHDAFERFIQRKRSEESVSQGTRNSPGESSRRRYNTRLAASIGMKEAQLSKCIKNHADDRSLALLEMHYDVYNSPVPASFVRAGTKRKRSYGADEYFKLILTSEIGSGATGVVHDAHLEVQVGGHTLRIGVVVKLAFTPEEVESMRHEFSVYEHLALRGVQEGIPLVFGLFEDVETNAMALVMNHVGRSLWDLRTDLDAIQVKVSSSVRDAYLMILSNIHKAGVRHCDLRPENLMLADDETVTIIDFDQATINTSTAAKKREANLLRDLLEGGILYDSRR